MMNVLRVFRGKSLKRVFRGLFLVFKWLLISVVALEVLSFLAITGSNYILYGHAREGSRAVYDAYTLFLQPHGLRPTAYNSMSDDPEKNRRVWAFGGSTMRGATPLSDRTIPSCISMLLNSNRNGLHFSVYNCGVNSFNSLLETKYLQKMLINLEPPDVIIFYDGANDVKYFLEHRDPQAHHGYRRVRALIESYYQSWFGLLKPLNAAAYASFTKELYDKIMQVAVPVNVDSPEFASMIDAVEKRYDYINKLAKAYGVQFILFWQPTLWVEDCTVAPFVKAEEKNLILDDERWATVRRNFTLPYNKLADRLADKEYFVNFRRILCNRQVPCYQPDGVHLTDDGRLAVADFITAVLKEKLQLDLPDSIADR